MVEISNNVLAALIVLLIVVSAIGISVLLILPGIPVVPAVAQAMGTVSLYVIPQPYSSSGTVSLIVSP
jgi:hypothetical protein